jgi:hypothetical protein
VIALAKRENLTVRQLAQRLGGYGGLGMVGTPQTIADEMQAWLELQRAACDGFNVMFPYLPGGLDDFVEKVVPELQRAACSDANTRARRCATIWACRGRRTAWRGATSATRACPGRSTQGHLA